MYCTLVREQYMPFLFIVLLRGNSVVFFRFALSRQTLPHKRSGIANGGQAALHAQTADVVSRGDRINHR